MNAPRRLPSNRYGHFSEDGLPAIRCGLVFVSLLGVGPFRSRFAFVPPRQQFAAG